MFRFFPALRLLRLLPCVVIRVVACLQWITRRLVIETDRGCATWLCWLVLYVMKWNATTLQCISNRWLSINLSYKVWYVSNYVKWRIGRYGIRDKWEGKCILMRLDDLRLAARCGSTYSSHIEYVESVTSLRTYLHQTPPRHCSCDRRSIFLL